MPKYSGASIYYTETLTQYEQKYCEYRAAGTPQIESYKKAYVNVDCEKMSRDTIQTRCSKIEKKDKVIKRIAELKELQKVKDFTDNQTQAEPFEVFENNPKKTMFYLLWNFMNDCKVELKRADVVNVGKLKKIIKNLIKSKQASRSPKRIGKNKRR